jgi:hypothetical protein
MRLLRTGAMLGVGAVVGRAVVRTLSDSANARSDHPRPLAVTVYAPPERVEQPVTAALARFDVETSLRPAPGDRGTEVTVLPKETAGPLGRLVGTYPRQDLRRVLRAVKSEIEAGEVLEPDRSTTGRPTPGGMLVRLATRRARGVGRL